MNNFQIEQELRINAPADKIFARMINDVTAWWDHGFTENPKAIVLEPKVGGRFYEEFRDGGGALYATVTYLKPNEKLVLQGPMGMSGAVFGNISFELKPEGSSTLLMLSHRAFGDVTDDYKKNYTSGWKALLGERLKSLVETGAAPA